ncbi:AAA family ATPase [uncultured Sulfitobacter sp.]|uniref:AAA family ATPase n=1 Tax=uncultured Sulfitobacter sp. TaxID=191468 RepID=UPI0030D8B88B|tara:strand:+ start:2764 stop:4161 length:1398 start_codon:yes stop_codon:yes gene_type:complete
MNTLNHEQQTVKQAIETMQGGDRLVVSGRAGSGKTYAITNSVAKRTALFLTPTHPARTVLEQELQDKRHTVATIHSAIGWFRRKNDSLLQVDGYLSAKEAKLRQKQATDLMSCPFSKADIIIVDEFSMVGSFLFEAIEEYAKEFDLPVVYSGDRFQLPPVRDHEVIMDQGFQTITMDCSMRFPKDSEIFRLGEALRERIEGIQNGSVPYLYGGADVQVVSGRNWMTKLTQGYKKGDSLLTVTSDNATLKLLRGSVRGVDHDQLIEGDHVTSKQTDDIFRNGEQFTVAKVERHLRVLEDVPGSVSRFNTLQLDGFAITFAEGNREAFILKDDKQGEKHAMRIRSLYSKSKINREAAVRILDWLEQTNSFELSALATVHKSQGRSVDTVYIDTKTVLGKPAWLSEKEHLRSLYTAITRARKRVMLYAMEAHCSQALPVAGRVDLLQPTPAIGTGHTDQGGGLLEKAS